MAADMIVNFYNKRKVNNIYAVAEYSQVFRWNCSFSNPEFNRFFI